ncbi:MAG: tetratricopeptide repeat protein [Candidatus Cloacimonadota bacterium]|nr:MAG: tetratricopeptide repeat protein [Candidatus Cloacimonadota bacterium]
MRWRNIFLIIFSIFLLTGCAQTQKFLRERFPKEESFRRADDYLTRRLYRKALNEYEAVLSIYPDDIETLKRIAELYYIKRDWEDAVESYEKLPPESKGKELVLHYYEAKMKSVESDSVKLEKVKNEMKDLAKEFLTEQKKREESLSTAYELFFMADTDSVAIKPYKEAVIKEFPNSKTGYDIAGNDFYNGLYPIWRNDTLKVGYLENFLKRHPETEWRITVYQSLLSSLYRLKRYDKMEEAGEKFLNEESENPFAYSYLSYLLLESEVDKDKAIKYARRAIELELGYEKPENYPVEQWALNKKALYGDARMSLARALLLKGEIEEGEKWIKDAIKNTHFGVNDYKSNCSYFYILGQIEEKAGKSKDALYSYSMSLIEGDVRNKWAPKADSALVKLYKKIYKKDKNLLTFVRDEMDYRGIVFVDVTEKMGFGDIKTSRIAWGDYNNDGYDDILLNGSRIFKNIKGKRFEEVTEAVGIKDYSASGGIWGDWNNDLLMDFYSISGGKEEKGDRLWKQTSDGKFIDVTLEAGRVTNDFSTEGAAWGDANRDGYLDLYLANYENWAEHSYFPDAFYLSVNGKTFDEVLNEVGMSPPFNEERAGRGVNWGDYDNDGDQDIYVSNYRLQENFLWRNNGDGTFTNTACLLGVAGDEVEGWWGHTIGSSWGDYDNDGDLDLITANLAHPRYIEFSNKTKLYENLGPPEWRFVDRREEAGIKFEETHSDPTWGDFDNDGDLDLYITCVYEGRKSFLYENLGDGKFRDVTYLAGVRVFNGWGCAFSDFDNDGDLDLFVASGSGVHLFENKRNINNYLEVKVIGTKSNSSGIGARITVKQGDKIQIREVQGGKGTTSQNSFVQFFGFGDDDSLVDVKVRFPGGIKKHLKNVKLNQRIEIRE